MYGRSGLDRFKKAQSLEPFQVSVNSAPKNTTQPTTHKSNSQPLDHVIAKNSVALDAMPSAVPAPVPTTQIGGGQSTWHPPDWAIEPRTGVYYLEVMKDKEVLDRINLDRRRHIFGRQFQACDFVLDHQSVSRQHAVVIPHKNGSIYVIDLGSAHGTFVANERLTKDTPAELEVGQSLRFAASTRSYILRKNEAALFPHPPLPTEINLPSPPDPSDEDGVVAYNTILNRYGLGKSNVQSKSSVEYENSQLERPGKRIKKSKVIFRDQVGGELVEVVGVSDGVDVETEPGPVGVEGGSLVGKYESLVQTTVVPKGKEQWSAKADFGSQKGVTDKLQEVLNKVKSAPKGGMYDDLYGETLSGKMGSSWAYSSASSGARQASSTRQTEAKFLTSAAIGKPGNNSSHADDDVDDDLFGD